MGLCPGRRDDGLDALPGRGVGEGLGDAVEREARGDEPRDAQRRQEGEGAAEGGAAAEHAADPDLAVLDVEEVQREPAALGAHAHQVHDAGEPGQGH